MTRFQTTLGELNFYEFMKLDYENAYEISNKIWDEAEVDIELSEKFFTDIDNRIDYETDRTIQKNRDRQDQRARKESNSSRTTHAHAQNTHKS